jgi:hypothetical protein
MRGEPRYHKIVGRAGRAVERGFCPTCGSQVTVKLERLPDILGLQAGSLDDPSVYRPIMDVFTASAQPWDQTNPKRTEASLRPAFVIGYLASNWASNASAACKSAVSKPSVKQP